MIAVKLMGGLGNQMFQYALGRKIALSKNTKLALDLSFFTNHAEGDTVRHYELDCFKLIPGITKISPIPKSFLRIFAKQPNFTHTYNEPRFPFHKDVFLQPDDTLFQGYWQTEKYFSDIRDQLLDDFSLKEALSKEDLLIQDTITAQTSVSLHVRRGDYVTNKNANKFHGLKGIDYYSKAIEIISKKVPTFKLFVFSDDIAWCKKNLAALHSDIVFVDGNRAGYIDMFLMKQCNHNITANSSFSWWAAWLNINDDKIVISPKIWFEDPNVDTSDVIPKSWQKI